MRMGNGGDGRREGEGARRIMRPRNCIQEAPLEGRHLRGIKVEREREYL